MKKVLSVYFIWVFLALPAFCAYADDSIDASIKKTYNTGKIEKELLPNLPLVEPSPILEQNNQSTVFSPLPKQNAVISQNYNKEYKEIKIKKGTKFKVKSYSAINDTTPRGTKVTFKSMYPETSRYVTIPAGTILTGQVIDSHSPQYTGNGGLIQIKVDELTYKNAVYYINANVSTVNYKRVYINNIKGKHTYLKNMGKIIKPGKRFLGKTWKMSESLTNGPQILLIPFALGSGLIVFGANVIVSPALAIFSTGESIKIPASTYFEIKLKEDAIIKDY